MNGLVVLIQYTIKKESIVIMYRIFFLKFFFLVCLLVFICRYRLVSVKEDSGK